MKSNKIQIDISVATLVKLLFFAVAILSLIAWIFSLVINPIVSQTQELVENAPQLVDKISSQYHWVSEYFDQIQIDQYLSDANSSITQWSGDLSSGILSNAWNLVFSLAGGVLVFLFILVLTFYLLIGEETIAESIVVLFPQKQQQGIKKLIKDIQSKLGYWARGQLFLSIIIGILNFIMLELLNVEYSIAFSVFAGLMEVVPMIGPILTTFVIVIFLLPSSLLLAFIAFIGGIVIQQLENTFIVPYVMNKAVGLNPLYVLLSIMIGQKIFGVVGAILAVPIVVTVQIIVNHIQTQENHYEEPEEKEEPVSLAKLFQSIKMKFVK
jgi:predicted PurR-regulated permease PerM